MDNGLILPDASPNSALEHTAPPCSDLGLDINQRKKNFFGGKVIFLAGYLFHFLKDLDR